MVIIMLCISLLILLALVVVNIIREIRKRNDSRMSFRESLNLVDLPVLTFYNNGKRINLLLDTGSTHSHINSSILKSLDYEKTNGEVSLTGMEGNSTIVSFCKMIITYNDRKFEEEFGITDLEETFNIVKQESGVQIHGILGNKFFEKYKYVIDFKNFTAYLK